MNFKLFLITFTPVLLFAGMMFLMWRFLFMDHVARGAKRPCSTCRFYEKSDRTCREPSAKELADPITGRVTWIAASTERGRNSVVSFCGVAGWSWRPIKQKKTPLTENAEDPTHFVAYNEDDYITCPACGGVGELGNGAYIACPYCAPEWEGRIRKVDERGVCASLGISWPREKEASASKEP
jgi:DNA-directed RNA polymerase subunit RPC12/RpoP